MYLFLIDQKGDVRIKCLLTKIDSNYLLSFIRLISINTESPKFDYGLFSLSIKNENDNRRDFTSTCSTGQKPLQKKYLIFLLNLVLSTLKM